MGTRARTTERHTHLHLKQLSPFMNICPHGLPGVTTCSLPGLARICTSLRVACSGRLELELGRKRCANEPQKESYSSDKISARVEGVKTNFLDPGMVSSANRRRARGSAVRSRGCMDPRNLEGKKDDKLDILGLPKIGQSCV